MDQFQPSSTPRIRRKRKRGPGGEITLPTTATIKEVNEAIKQSHRWSLYSGRAHCSKQYSKVTLTQDGQLKTDFFHVERKYHYMTSGEDCLPSNKN